MKILFSPDDEGFFNDSSTLFKYGFCINFRHDEPLFDITDSCGRSVCFEYTDLEEIQRALIIAQHYVNPQTLDALDKIDLVRDPNEIRTT